MNSFSDLLVGLPTDDIGIDAEISRVLSWIDDGERPMRNQIYRLIAILQQQMTARQAAAAALEELRTELALAHAAMAVAGVTYTVNRGHGEALTKAAPDDGVRDLADICTWTEEHGCYGLWRADCDSTHDFSEAEMTPLEYGYKFCPVCGKSIGFVPWVEEEEEEEVQP